MHTHLLTSGCSFTTSRFDIITPYTSPLVYPAEGWDKDGILSEFQQISTNQDLIYGHHAVKKNDDSYKLLVEQIKNELTFKTSSWSPLLALELGIPLLKVVNYGYPGQGNQMIARNIVHGVEEMLASGVPAKDILVGVQWSSITRGSCYSSSIPPDYFTQFKKGSCFYNSVQFISEPPELKNSAGWKLCRMERLNEDPHYESINYYKINNESSTLAIESAERIHWIQEYLRGKGIDFFFTNMSQRSSIFDSEVEDIPDMHVRKTIDLVDRSKFCEYLGIAEWQSTYFNNRYLAFEHPTPISAYKYVQDQILPHLAKKGLINT